MLLPSQTTPLKTNKNFDGETQSTVKKKNTHSELPTNDKLKSYCRQHAIKTQAFSQQDQLKKVKKLWTKEEDHLLVYLVQTQGAKQWGQISNNFDNRCGKQCRERWHNHLRHGIKKGQWTFSQQWILFLGVHAYGQRWSLISKILPNRTQNTIKNHWNCKMKPLKQKLNSKMELCLSNGSWEEKGSLSERQKSLLFTIYQKKYLGNQNEVGVQNDQKIKQIFINCLKDFYQTKQIIQASYTFQSGMDVQSQYQSYSSSHSNSVNFQLDQQKDQELKVQYVSSGSQAQQQEVNSQSEQHMLKMDAFHLINKNYFDGSPSQK